MECGYGGFNHTINQFVNFSQEPIQIDLKNSTNFNGFTNRIDYLLENEFQEFRKKNTSIERVHEISESMTPQELGNYLRQPPAFRRMIIKKLIDNKDYEDFAIKYIESAKVKASQKSAFRNYDLAADSLYKSLKSF